MKLTSITLLVFALQVSAKGFTQEKISLSFDKAPLEKVFNSIMAQTKYSIICRNEYAKGKTVTIKAKDLNIKEALELCLKNLDLAYEIVGTNIAIHPKEKNDTREDGPMRKTQSFVDIAGRVVNENGDPVLASVSVKGTKKGTTTNENGEFVLRDVDENAIIIFSGVGLETTEISLNGKSIINVTVKIDASPLQETIIKGYYSTTKRLNTGSVSKVTSQEIKNEVVLNPLQAIKARVPGLQITEQTGMPGGNFTVRIRGQNSLRNDNTSNGNNPLYVIDGVPFTSSQINIAGVSPYPQLFYNPSNGISPLSTINSADIESIEILKDADATAIFGSRGANGVILITTKKGKTGKTRVDANFYTSIGKVTRRMDLMNTQQYIEMRKEAKKNDNVNILANDYDINGTWDTTRYTDWQKELIGNTARINDAQLAISGGTTNIQYLLSGGFHKESTVFPGDFYNQRASTHFNLNVVSPDNKFKLTLTADYSHGVTNLLSQDLTSVAFQLAPNAPALYDSEGNINWEKNTFQNPLAYTKRPYNNKLNNIIANALLSYKIAKGLSIQSSFGISGVSINEMSKILRTSFNPSIAPLVQLSTTFGNGKQNTLIIEPQINYVKRIGKGELRTLIGTTFQDENIEQLKQSASGFLSEDLMDNIAAANQSTISSTYTYSKYRYNAVYGRIGYDWQNKYLINLTGRRDGSSRFGSDKRFSNFGAVGAGWIFSGEKFIQNSLSFLSFGKIRLSYGTAGSDQIPNYGFLDGYTTSGAGQYQAVPGLIPARLFNPDFRWEVNRKFETGVDLGFFNDRILLNVAYYRNRSSNQLVGYTLPSTAGFTSIQNNLDATVQNTGIELGLNTANLKSRSISWSTNFNITIPRSTLISFPGLASSSYADVYVVGQPLRIVKTLNYLGIDEQTGFFRIEDIDGNGRYTAIDMQTLADLSQKYYGGLQNQFTYKSFTVDFLFQFIKQQGYNYLFFAGAPPGVVNANQPVEVLDRWQKPGDQPRYQRYNTGTFAGLNQYSGFRSSNAVIVDASFIRLKNASISYQIPEKLLQKLKVKQARLYAQGQNLWTITNYFGYDPENQSLGLPPLRILAAGVNIVF